jgi:dipeptidyl aminopeptidase/acylaminoacyl peptidase
MQLVLILVFAISLTPPAQARRFAPQDLVSLSRIANPAVSADGRWLVWDQRETDFAANKGHHSLWRLDLNDKDAAPEKFPIDTGAEDSDPAFGPNGQLYFLSNGNSGKTTVWRIAMTGGEALQVTEDYDLAGFKVSPTGDSILVWTDRPVGAESLDAMKIKPEPDQGSARIYDRLFVRHWDRWADGQRSQLFVIPMVNGRATGPGHAIEGELIGDSLQKPQGSGEQIAWSRDGSTVYFALREAGRIEPLSSNLDIFAAAADGSKPPTNLTASNRATDTLPTVSPDGRWLAWTATKRPGFEDDRQVLMLREIATGRARVITESWDRSVESIAWDSDSSAVYVTAKDTMDEPAFRVAVSDGKVHRLTGAGHVSGVVALPRGGFIYMLDGLTAPADFWLCDAVGHSVQLTHVNALKLLGIDWPAVIRFTFRGANRDTVDDLPSIP